MRSAACGGAVAGSAPGPPVVRLHDSGQCLRLRASSGAFQRKNAPFAAKIVAKRAQRRPVALPFPSAKRAISNRYEGFSFRPPARWRHAPRARGRASSEAASRRLEARCPVFRRPHDHTHCFGKSKAFSVRFLIYLTQRRFAEPAGAVAKRVAYVPPAGGSAGRWPCFAGRVPSSPRDGVTDGLDPSRHFASRTLVSFAPRKVTSVNVSVPTRSGPVLVHDPS